MNDVWEDQGPGILVVFFAVAVRLYRNATS
jgi:hypothetical protein